LPQIYTLKYFIADKHFLHNKHFVLNDILETKKAPRYAELFKS